MAKWNAALKEIKRVRANELDQIRMDNKDLQLIEEHKNDAHKKKNQLRLKTSQNEEIEVSSL